jgi:FtsH-binding integral membrane protein
MNSPNDPWLTLLLVALFGLVLFLRIHFPNASLKAQAVVLLVAAVSLFSICTSFVTMTEASSRGRTEIIATRAAR